MRDVLDFMTNAVVFFFSTVFKLIRNIFQQIVGFIRFGDKPEELVSWLWLMFLPSRWMLDKAAQTPQEKAYYHVRPSQEPWGYTFLEIGAIAYFIIGFILWYKIFQGIIRFFTEGFDASGWVFRLIFLFLYYWTGSMLAMNPY